MTYTLHPEAECDIAAALDFYSEQAGRSVAERFLDEFERVARLLAEYPDLRTPTARGRKTFPLKLFPYLVVYRQLENGLRIIIVRHQHRWPGFASGRK